MKMNSFTNLNRWRTLAWLAFLSALVPLLPAQAQETTCARVKIEIKQELTLERQAFDAEMKINNTTDTSTIENVAITVKVTDEAGTPVAITDNPNDLSAKFFIRLSSKQNIDAIDGTGKVTPRSSAIIDWLIIPAPGAAGNSPLGKKYLIGATLKYRFGGEDTVLNVAPDVITVKPLPQLTLDYFLPKDVQADDPLTPEIEPIVPFTLGVRVKNTGIATAKKLKIDSAQPKIVENRQGLLIGFRLTGSYVNDQPAQNTLLIPFGEIAGNTSKMGRWNMETTLTGTFTEFTAKFSHSDELGGALTSILQAVNTHVLIHDVRVDIPGRDTVRDFLAQDGDVIRVYESDSTDTLVTDRSSVASLVVEGSGNNGGNFRLTFPATAGFAYVKLPDPFGGRRELNRVLRSDAKQMAVENVWLSQTRNAQSHRAEYWINFFDNNTSGSYGTEFKAPGSTPKPPVWQFIPERSTREGQRIGFIVEASSPDGNPVTLSAAPLPPGATFVQDPPDPATPNLARAAFDWTPATGSAGQYPITYTASDGTLSTTAIAGIKVDVDALPPGPATPAIDAPAPDAQVASLTPTLSVTPSSNAQDPTSSIEFELYSDAALSLQVAKTVKDKAASGPTQWQVAPNLNDNTRYWWRARAVATIAATPTTPAQVLNSDWVNGRFFVNLFNDPPDVFNLTSPVPNGEVASPTPQLAWTNAVDKDGDSVTYTVSVYKNSGLTQLAAQGVDIAADPSGSSNWTVATPLVNHQKYWWQVVAKDSNGAQTISPARPFTVNTSNSPPTVPVIQSPAVGGQSTTPSTVLTVQNSTDADNDPLSYVFEIDRVNTFDSSNKQSSGPIAQGTGDSGSGNSTSWQVGNLIENQRYWWRVKAQDGKAESNWVVGDFLLNASNEAPPTPAINNPGDGAWSGTLQPTLSASPVLDPEGEAVHYQFEVYRDAALTQKVAEGSSAAATPEVPNPTSWQVTPALQDHTSHWWRVRALDIQNAASDWSAPAVLYVSTVPYQNPGISLLAPAGPVVPTVVTGPSGARVQTTISWEGTDPNIEANVALYYSTTRGTFDGGLIANGLRQSAGTQRGSYVWDVTGLASGTYYIYAIISDARGQGQAYAAGALVVPAASQSGSVVVNAATGLRTGEDGSSASFSVKLGQAPAFDVVLPLDSSNRYEGVASPASLTFTAQNWATPQTVTVAGQNDCAPDGDQSYQIRFGAAQTLDPNYIGQIGSPVSLVNKDNIDFPNTTSNVKVHICGLTVVTERQLSANSWEYTLKVDLTNAGPAVSSLLARLTTVPSGISVAQDSLQYGAIGAGETARNSNTVTLRSATQITKDTFKLAKGYKWTVTTQP
jgi:hypothetical protein